MVRNLSKIELQKDIPTVGFIDRIKYGGGQISYKSVRL